MDSLLAALPVELLWYLGLSLVICLPGFYRVVYFISTGYAFSIAAIAGGSLWLLRDTLTPLAALHAVGLLLYGLRLGGFLLRREFTSAGYRRELEEAQEASSRIKLPGLLGIWVGVALLYVAMASPAVYALASPAPTGAMLGLQAAGLAALFGGLALETWADRQKSAYKLLHPDRFCDVGLYRWVRCPNYLGEVIVWVGSFAAGVGAYGHWARWTTATVGLVCILLIMVGSTRRLELKQDERYGEREDYRAYVAKTPILWPLLPIYSFRNARIYLG